MTLRTQEIEDAVVALLERKLQDQGLKGSGSARNAVPVVTDVTEDDPQLFVRVDGWTVTQGTGGAGRYDRYVFLVHCFAVDSSNDDEIVRGAREAKRVQQQILKCLDGASVIERSGFAEHLSSSGAIDENPSTHHVLSRFQILAEGQDNG